ncbi:ABC transporter substrate-binding protein [Alicyclobacillus kakegawensis]|uniref:ABC transporter substrate-binding protein n=1 Tax=Alicyclobacillus kakegawensis TaxID=392012 RepID=UPI0008353181|nr:extracellular solute-binding protein [Alicyclobacillus kakegawensis]
MLKKSALVTTALALTFTGLVAGCGTGGNTSNAGSNSNTQSSNGSNGGSASSSTSHTITIWDSESGTMQNMMQTATDNFNKSQKQVTAKIQFYNDNAYKQKIQIAMGANNPPDIIFSWGGGTLKTYVDAHKVVNLDSFLKANPSYKNKFFPGVWGNVTFNGHVYGVPEGAGTQPELLFYNKAIFRKYHLPVPTTWPQLLSDVKTLKANGIAPISLGARDQWPDLLWLMYLTDRIGGPSVFNNIINNKPNAWSNPAVAKAIQMIQQLIRAGGFENGYAGVSADSNEDQALLYSGKAAMLLQGSWIFPSLKSSAPQFTSQDLGWTTFPKVPGGKGNPNDLMGNISTYYSVSSSSKDISGAEEYLKDVPLNSYEIKTEIQNGVIPPVKGLAGDFKNVPDSNFLTYVYNKAEKAPVFVTGWDQLLPPSEAQTLLKDLNSVFVLKMTPQQFVKSMNAAIPKS